MLRSQERKEDAETLEMLPRCFWRVRTKAHRRQVRAKLRGHKESFSDELRWEGGGGIKLNVLFFSCRKQTNKQTKEGGINLLFEADGMALYK